MQPDMSKGSAVVDLEITGIFPTKQDRVVELVIVLISPDGEIGVGLQSSSFPRIHCDSSADTQPRSLVAVISR